MTISFDKSRSKDSAGLSFRVEGGSKPQLEANFHRSLGKAIDELESGFNGFLEKSVDLANVEGIISRKNLPSEVIFSDAFNSFTVANEFHRHVDFRGSVHLVKSEKDFDQESDWMLKVEGKADINNLVFLVGSGTSLNVGNYTTLEYLNVNNAVDFNSILNVDGAVTVNNNLILTAGSIDVQVGGVEVAGNVICYNNLFMNKATNPTIQAQEEGSELNINHLDPGSIKIGFVGVPLIALDVDRHINLGSGTTVVVPIKSTAGDPSGYSGSIYYNANSNSFRASQNSVWYDLLSPVILGTNASGTNLNLSGIATINDLNVTGHAYVVGDLDVPTGTVSFGTGLNISAGTIYQTGGLNDFDSIRVNDYLNMNSNNINSVGTITFVAGSGTNLNITGSVFGATKLVAGGSIEPDPGFDQIVAIESANESNISVNVYSSTIGHGPNFSFRHSLNNTIGTKTVTTDNTELGQIHFTGVDSSGGWDIAAQIRSYQDGAAGAANVPGDLVFRTNDGTGLQTAMTINAAGDINVANELQGCRLMLTAGYGSPRSAVGYLIAGHDGQQMTGIRGWVAHRNGSIVGVSASFNCTISGAGAYVQIQGRVNGTYVVSTNQIDCSSTGTKSGYLTQSRGTDTFSAGDILTMFMYFSGGPTIDDVFAAMEIVYDT